MIKSFTTNTTFKYTIETTKYLHYLNISNFDHDVCRTRATTAHRKPTCVTHQRVAILGNILDSVIYAMSLNR